mgnify:CR=1 FL=1
MDYSRAVVYVQKDRERVLLAEASYSYQVDVGYTLTFEDNQEKREFSVNGEKLLVVEDDAYSGRGAGFTITTGTMTAMRTGWSSGTCPLWPA